jgi:hypothetical protein
MCNAAHIDVQRSSQATRQNTALILSVTTLRLRQQKYELYMQVTFRAVYTLTIQHQKYLEPSYFVLAEKVCKT